MSKAFIPLTVQCQDRGTHAFTPNAIRKRPSLSFSLSSFPQPLALTVMSSPGRSGNAGHGLRRSPRLNATALPDDRPRKPGRRVSGEHSLRRSPRFASAQNGTRGTILVKRRRSKGEGLTSNAEVEEEGGKGVLRLGCSEEKCSGTIISFVEASSEEKALRIVESLEYGRLEAVSQGAFTMESGSSSESKPDGDKLSTPLGNLDKRSWRLISANGNDVSDESKTKIRLNVVDKSQLRRSSRLSSYYAQSDNIKSDPDEICSKQSTKTATTLFAKRENSLIEFSESDEKQPSKKFKIPSSLKNKQKKCKNTAFFIGDPIPDDEAQERWRWRYELKSERSRGQCSKKIEDDQDEVVWNVQCHYAQAEVDNCTFSLGDCVYIQGDGGEKHVGRILEFFRTTDGENYFRVQWFYRVEDTVIKEEGAFHDKRRLFYSTIMNDNLIDCIISKVNVKQITPRVGLRLNSIPPSDLYYDMEYCVDYSTFRSLVTNNSVNNHGLSSPPIAAPDFWENRFNLETCKGKLALLDLFSGCGGMSTGLCLGAKLSEVNLTTRWAVDNDSSACKSFRLNHPETHVRNEPAEDFLKLLKEWEKLCKRFKVTDVGQPRAMNLRADKYNKNYLNEAQILTVENSISRLVDICYGDPNNTGKHGLHFKVQWKGNRASGDTWESIEGLRNCQGRIRDFVESGWKSKILPLPGDVDVICGGPPCQGISGYNRYRNVGSPLADDRNHQIIVFMDIVTYLKPKYVLMENVVDILRFDKASLGRYALSRLVHMSYQARVGTMAAGCYGLPQFRLRVFLWGAHPSEKLPQFPLPTHDVVVRYWPPPEFERNTVAYDEGQIRELKKAVVLQDAISDLPAVTNFEGREKMPYRKPPETELQRYIRSTQYEMTGSALSGSLQAKPSLFDHRPWTLTEDDYLRVCQIPKRKGANFRDLPGVVVGADNVVRRDPKEQKLLPSGKPLTLQFGVIFNLESLNIRYSKEQKLLPSGKQLVPDYAFTFEQGKSRRPFARLWWDETVPTVVTCPSCHNQVALHPEQDRILTMREYARLQGFPDYYRFCGTVKERYCQIGNAVAIPVARALGYALGLAFQKRSGDEPLLTLPPNFSHSNYLQLAELSTEASEGRELVAEKVDP